MLRDAATLSGDSSGRPDHVHSGERKTTLFFRSLFLENDDQVEHTDGFAVFLWGASSVIARRMSRSREPEARQRWFELAQGQRLKRREFGQMAGLIRVSDDFDEPIDEAAFLAGEY